MTSLPSDPLSGATSPEASLTPQEQAAGSPPVGPAHEEGQPVESQPDAAESQPHAASGAPEPQPPAAPTPAPTAHTGTVLRLTNEEVLLDLGEGRQGAVPLIEFAGQSLPGPGDSVSVIVLGEDPTAGRLSVSKRQADELTFWEMVKPGDVIEGVVTGMNKGGLDIDIGGARAFLPSSQVDTHRVKDISTLIGEHVRCLVTQVDKVTRDLVVSRRKIIDKERKDQRVRMLDILVEGEVRKGTVTNLTEYGAFVSLGGIEGLLHITDMSWSRIRHPSEMLQLGQEIDVAVIKVDKGAGKVSLGLKQIKPDPWNDVESRYPAGAKVKARVLRFADFGAFVELEEGIEALLPVSEMSWSRRLSHPSEVVKLGEELDLVVLKTEAARRRISLGLKQTEENPWDTAAAQCPPNAMVKGKVVRITDFGAFVEILPGVEGMIHISELSDRRVRTVQDVVKEGQEVEARVLKFDRGAQRISLSLKPEPKPAAPEPAMPESKKKKRPLRGGLSSHFEW